MAEANRNRLVVISLDAMGARDLPFAETLPNFKRIMDKSAICRNVASVYPSVTYPAHASIVTGNRPNRHGVINNKLLQPRRPVPDWMWQRKYIKGTTLYDEAIKKGYKTAALMWPVTAKSRIHYNIPEVLANRPWQNQIAVSSVNGSFLYQWDLLLRFGKMIDGIRQPALDNFVHSCVCYTLKTKRPDLALIHYTDLDTNRHIYGLDHEKSKDAMRRHDKRLGEILEILEETGDMSKTTLVLLGDHCQMDVHTAVYFNYLLQEKGFLKTQKDKIVDYDFVAKGCDGSCYIYQNPKKKLTTERCKQLKEVFEQCRDNEIMGIEQIFTGEEAGKLGADESCFLMIEARQGYYFLDGFRHMTQPVNEIKKEKMRSTHGYLPDKPDYQTFFMAMGRGIKAGVEVDSMQLYDEGPTLAKLLGVDLGATDGRVVEEMLEEQSFSE